MHSPSPKILLALGALGLVVGATAGPALGLGLFLGGAVSIAFFEWLAGPPPDMARIRRALELVLAPGEALVRRAHDAAPGETPRVFGGYRETAGRTSYDVLAECFPRNPGGPILELGCGDAVLTGMLRGKGWTVHGLDLSVGELGLASKRLGSPAGLVHGHAMQLPFRDGSLAAVASHMVLMLIDPLEPVLRDVRRVLAPEGRLVAVIGAGRPGGLVRQVFTEELVKELQAGEIPVPRLGDPVARDADLLRALLGEVGMVVDVLHEFEVARVATPEELWGDLGTMYDALLVPVEGRERMRRAFVERLAPALDADGRIENRFALRLLAARPA